jgi:hypothetical protein
MKGQNKPMASCYTRFYKLLATLTAQHQQKGCFILTSINQHKQFCTYITSTTLSMFHYKYISCERKKPLLLCVVFIVCNVFFVCVALCSVFCLSVVFYFVRYVFLCCVLL